jgi:hypothetical protein
MHSRAATRPSGSDDPPNANETVGMVEQQRFWEVHSGFWVALSGDVLALGVCLLLLLFAHRVIANPTVLVSLGLLVTAVLLWTIGGSLAALSMIPRGPPAKASRREWIDHLLAVYCKQRNRTSVAYLCYLAGTVVFFAGLLVLASGPIFGGQTE